MTAAAPSPVLAIAFRDEAVMVLANMTMASLGGDETLGERGTARPDDESVTDGCVGMF